jgi:phosphatidylinositol dimannoside acyltransferase
VVHLPADVAHRADAGPRVISGVLARAAETTIPALPDTWDAPLGEIVGTFAYLLSPRARRAVQGNLSVVCGRPDVARRVFVAQVRHYMETFRILRLSRERLVGMVDVHGWSDLTDAVARGKGVLLSSAHLGPVVLTGQILAARGLQTTVLVEHKSDQLGRLIDRARSAMGMTTIETSAALGIGRILRRGGVVGVLADRAVTGVGERVPFFGRPALMPSGHIAIALRTGAAIVPAFALREGGRLQAYLRPALEIPRTGDRAADVHEGVRLWAAELERWVARAPDQWSIFAPMWDR